MPEPQFRLYLVTDCQVCAPDRLLAILARLGDELPPGTLAVQLREKDLCTSDLLDLAGRVRDVLAPRAVPLLINDRIDVALAIGAQGVHLPGTGFGPGDARRIWPGLIGISTHAQTPDACFGEVDFCTFGPVFDTPSKRPYGPPQGLGPLRTAAAASRIPLFAIGGITPANAGLLADTGIHGIAVIRALLQASNPVATARLLLERASIGANRRAMSQG